MEKGLKLIALILSVLLPPAGLIYGAILVHKDHDDMIGWYSVVIGGVLTIALILTGIMMFY